MSPRLRALALPVIFLLVGMAGNAFAYNLTVSVAPPSSANAGSSFSTTAENPYDGACGKRVRIYVESGDCSGGSTSWTGPSTACFEDGGPLTQTITMNAGALTACVVRMDGTDTYIFNSDPTVRYTVKINQSIVWSGVPASSLMTTPDYAIVATAKTSDGVANTGMAITYTSTTPSVCTVTAGGVVHNVAAGTCSIDATAASSANFVAKTSTVSWSVSKVNQTITVTTPAPASATYGSSFTVAATAPGGTVVVSTSGGCSNVGNNVTMTSGTTACTVLYNQAGNASYNAAPQVSSSTTASKAAQTITVTTPAPANAAYGNSFTVAATTSSGNSVTVTTSGGCSNVGNNVTMTSGTQDCVVHYNQSGNSNYGSAPQVTSTTFVVQDQDLDGAPDATDNCPLIANPTQTNTDGDAFGDACDSTPNGDTDGDGIDNNADNCPLIANPAQTDTDGDGIGNACDSTPNGDTDGDGVDNAADNCPLVANPGQANNDGDAEGDACDTDDDNDGVLDAAPDNCPFTANTNQADLDLDGVGNVCDPDYTGDTDGDGIVDGIDNCPVVSNPAQTDTDGDGIGDACDSTPNGDTDNDGVDNNSDNCPLIANPAQTDTDGDGIGNACDSTPNGDTDSDGIDNNGDNCPLIANPTQTDTDGDGIGDACDSTPNGDTDGDGIDNNGDNCPLIANPTQTDTDGDGIGDACDSTPTGDTDNDGVDNGTDNCPAVANIDQLDTDNDGIGDVCDSTPTGDTDGDGVDNGTDNCPAVANPLQEDTDLDGIGDACDSTPNGDTDNDGIDNNTDNCPAVANPLQEDTDADGVGDACDSTPTGDTDNDGVDNGTDNCPAVANVDQLDTDGDGVGDACDSTPTGDTDNDGVDNGTDNCPAVANPLQEDTDLDGIGDACDTTPNGDTDNDGVDNNTDNCPAVANVDQLDTDLDGTGDACDTTPNGDTDNDGIDNNADNCLLIANADQLDTDNDGVGDVCDSTPSGDNDNDGVDNNADNCPLIANADQLDTDNDGVGDVCDTTPNGDPDGDGIDSSTDNCPLIANPDQLDTDGDGIGDVCDAYPNDPGVLVRGWGETKKDVFGFAVANAGDVNGDGHDDVVVGAYRWDVAKTKIPKQKKLADVGKVYVYSGADGELLKTFQSLSAGDWFGYSVAGADINGDGYSDIIVGAPRRDKTLPVVGNQKKGKVLKDAGAVYVYSGKPVDNYIELRAFHGEAAGDNLGFAVANAGNVDNDINDKEEIIYGVPKADPNGLTSAGIAVVCSYDAVDPLFTIKGKAKGDLLGRTVSGAGDVNGDGHDDVIVGMPKDDVSGLNAKTLKDAGAAAVYSGVDGGELFKVEGKSVGDWFGFAVSGAGDLDGNGKADVVVGAPHYDSLNNGKLLKDAGAVYAYSYDGTAVGQRLFKAEGQAKGDWLGYSVAAGGDLDKNGHADVVAGAPRRDRTNPLTGKPLKDVGAVFGFDRAGEQLFEQKGYRKADNYGWSLASAGDIDLDGYADIISSTPRADKVDPVSKKLLKDIGMMEVISGKFAIEH